MRSKFKVLNKEFQQIAEHKYEKTCFESDELRTIFGVIILSTLLLTINFIWYQFDKDFKLHIFYLILLTLFLLIMLLLNQGFKNIIKKQIIDEFQRKSDNG